MNNNEFKQRVLEESLFKEIKDKAVENSERFRKKYKDLDIDHSRLYKRIVNYQVKKYGRTLDPYWVDIEGNKEKIRKNARDRKSGLKRYWGFK